MHGVIAQAVALAECLGHQIENGRMCDATHWEGRCTRPGCGERFRVALADDETLAAIRRSPCVIHRPVHGRDGAAALHARGA